MYICMYIASSAVHSSFDDKREVGNGCTSGWGCLKVRIVNFDTTITDHETQKRIFLGGT